MINYYRHRNCPAPGQDTEWSDEWVCACNDRCPSCNAEIEPYESTGEPAPGEFPALPDPVLLFAFPPCQNLAHRPAVTPPAPPGFPKVVGNALVCSSGRAHQLTLLDRLYLRIGIVTAASLERTLDNTDPQQGC